MIKNKKISFLLILIAIFLSNCNTVQKAFDPQNKNTAEEFLVEKKSPLSVPPNFEELPLPSNEIVNKKSPINNIETLITEKVGSVLSVVLVSDKDFEQLILDKIKNN